MDFTGLFTFLLPENKPLKNASQPYYYDATWGYGLRTQISGTLQLDTITGEGSATVTPFAFFAKGNAEILDFQLKSIGNDWLLGNFNYLWNHNDSIAQIVLDGSGLFAELAAGYTVGEVFDASSCTASNACATPSIKWY